MSDAPLVERLQQAAAEAIADVGPMVEHDVRGLGGEGEQRRRGRGG